MEREKKSHNETVISFFDQGLSWWTDVYREDLPRGFFSFEMRRRLALVTALLADEVQRMDEPDVLECGCGPGDILELVAPYPCKLTGLDLNPRYLELAAGRVPRARLMDGNVESLPYPDGSFDVVYAVGVLPYVNDVHLAAQEMSRVTKAGGFVLVSVPNYWMLHLLFDPFYIFKFIKKLVGLERPSPADEFDDSKIRRFPLAQLRGLFHGHDMHEIRLMSTSYGPLKFWRREVLPLKFSIRISEVFRSWSERRGLAGLKHVGNHLILTLRKAPGPAKPIPGPQAHPAVDRAPGTADLQREADPQAQASQLVGR